MTIIRKSKITGLIAQMDESYQALRAVLSGGTPNPNIYDRYHENPEQYAAEFTEVDAMQARIAVKQFKAFLDVISDVKLMAEPARHQSR